MLRSNRPINFEGKYFKLNEGILLPRPKRETGPPILIGGNGPKLTLPLVANNADEWNAVCVTIPDYTNLTQILGQLIDAVRRKLIDISRSLITGCIFGKNSEDSNKRVSARTGGKGTP